MLINKHIICDLCKGLCAHKIRFQTQRNLASNHCILINFTPFMQVFIGYLIATAYRVLVSKTVKEITINYVYTL